jgi:DNA polymerase III epsilon subunit-like protein
MSSWDALKKSNKLQEKSPSIQGKTISGKKRKRIELKTAVELQAAKAIASSVADLAAAERKSKYFDVTTDILNDKIKDKYVALDCEMVGIGPAGRQSALARCCIVNYDGEVLYDQHVRPQAFVTDFRTKWSGIRTKDLRHGKAIAFPDCQKEVAAIIKDKILVGHALKNDLDVLMLGHTHTKIRDTATYRPYMKPHGRKEGKFRPKALRELAKQYLGTIIQTGEHDPSEDARTAMFLYRRCRKEWEDSLFKKKPMKIRSKSVEVGSHDTTSKSTSIFASDAKSIFEIDGARSNTPVSKKRSTRAAVDEVANLNTPKTVVFKLKKKKIESEE